MDFDKKYLWYAAAALGGYFLLRKVFAGGGGSAESSDALGPAYISYVSPGGGTLDQNYPYTGSQYGPQDSGALTANQSALATAAESSAASTQNILNSDTLLANVTELVSQQQAGFGFTGKYGFSSDIQAGLTMTSAGSPQFTLKTSYTPKDPSNAAKAIDDLTTQNASLNTQLSGAKAQVSVLQNQVSQLKAFDFNTFIGKFTQPSAFGRDTWYTQEVNNIANQANATIRAI